MNLRFFFASGQTIGGRKNQEDFSLVRRFRLANRDQDRVICAILSDGMGGHAAGERAARIIVNAFWNAFEGGPTNQPSRLEEYLREANHRLSDDIATHPEFQGMGATFLTVIVWNDLCSWLSVGDSPLLLVRNGRGERINADHSMAPVLDQMAAEGSITQQEALADRHRQSLRSAVFGGELKLIDQGGPFSLQHGDRLLLASDGIESFSIDQLSKMIMSSPESGASQAMSAMIEGIDQLKSPNQDNATAILICAVRSEGAD